MLKNANIPENATEVFASGGIAPFFHCCDELAAGRQVVLAVVVATSGSTPQVAGAMMSCDQAGKHKGTVGGGGCLEAEVRKRARDLLLAGGSLKCNLRLDHDLTVKDGMICGGEMTAIVVAIPAERATEWGKLRVEVERGNEAIVVLEVATESGPEVFAIRLEPEPNMTIAGAGHVGIEVAWLARRAGFAVTVVDDRPDLLAPARLPEGTRAIAGDIPVTLAARKFDPSAYVIIATRGHKDDLDALAAIVGRPLRYLGMLGSKRKIATLFAELRRDGATEADLARIYTPIGLDIGALTPAEIAVSIMGQVIAVRRRSPHVKTAQSLGGPNEATDETDKHR